MSTRILKYRSSNDLQYMRANIAWLEAAMLSGRYVKLNEYEHVCRVLAIEESGFDGRGDWHWKVQVKDAADYPDYPFGDAA